MTVAFANRWHQIEPLLEALFDVPVAGRDDWLHGHCADETLRHLIVQALDNVSRIEGLERGIAQWLPELADEPPDALPSISGYRVLRFVGAGGMASVFEAERELPGGPQTVALKLLRIDVHDLGERKRFLREQRILARLQHPHIAQLLDAGFAPTGTPFLALEFVAGDNLLTHCEQRGLDARGRLALFVDVCTAVEHAHRNLIVHRDLKPSNVLVGADGFVKLVDFGIAKLLTGEGERTRTEAQRLTRAYAAPEQIAGVPATTAIDVYALGMLLAELLCGGKPRRAGDDASANALDEATLRRRLGADLHAIIREATRPDPLRRYATVAALREDVERYLDGRPLRVRADTFAYRAFTFARQYALAIAIGMGVAVVLIGATAVSTLEAQRARRAAEDARMQMLVAAGEAQRTDALKTFLEGLFDTASPETKANESTADLLARGRARAERDFAAQPTLHVEILALIGDLERRSGHSDRAQPTLEEAAALATTQFSATDRRTLRVETSIAKNLDDLGRVRDATARLRKAIEAFEAGPDRDAPELVLALAWLAGMEERSGESAHAIEIGEKALSLARRVLPDDSDARTEAVTNLGWIFMDAGHADRAEPLLREALARKRRRFGAHHADVADAMVYLMLALVRRGQYGESEQLMRDALDIDADVHAGPHPQVAWHLNELAIVFALEGKLAAADTYYAKSIAMDQALGPGAALSEATTLGNRARIRFQQGDYAGAEAGLRDMIARKQRLLGADYGDNGQGYDRASLADVAIARGSFGEARALADDALAQARRRYHDAHPDTAFALTVQARMAAANGDRERAAATAEQAVMMYAALADPISEKSIRARILYGDTLRSIGRDHDAKSQFESALASIRATSPSSPALLARAAADLARADELLGDHAAARRLGVEARAALAEVESEPSTDRDSAMRLLADASARTKY